MSVAFVKEESAEAASETVLPARPISDRVNLVTETGLQMLHEELARANALSRPPAWSRTSTSGGASRPCRCDARYFAERIRTAQLQPAPASNDVVALGPHRFLRAGRRSGADFRIVGEDRRRISRRIRRMSHASPVATALIGRPSATSSAPANASWKSCPSPSLGDGTGTTVSSSGKKKARRGRRCGGLDLDGLGGGEPADCRHRIREE